MFCLRFTLISLSVTVGSQLLSCNWWMYSRSTYLRCYCSSVQCSSVMYLYTSQSISSVGYCIFLSKKDPTWCLYYYFVLVKLDFTNLLDMFKLLQQCSPQIFKERETARHQACSTCNLTEWLMGSGLGGNGLYLPHKYWDSFSIWNESNLLSSVLIPRELLHSRRGILFLEEGIAISGSSNFYSDGIPLNSQCGEQCYRCVKKWTKLVVKWNYSFSLVSFGQLVWIEGYVGEGRDVYHVTIV